MWKNNMSPCVFYLLKYWMHKGWSIVVSWKMTTELRNLICYKIQHWSETAHADKKINVSFTTSWVLTSSQQGTLDDKLCHITQGFLIYLGICNLTHSVILLAILHGFLPRIGLLSQGANFLSDFLCTFNVFVCHFH